jgi:S-formylglutathione hydrolase FrmB
MRSRPVLLSALFLALLPIAAAPASCQARLEVLTVPGDTLRGNPLHDPAERRIAVFLPSQYGAGRPLPVVYWLPGFGGGPDGFIGDAAGNEMMVQSIADKGAPVVFVVIDGRTRWGCSQYIDSPGQGRYATYIAREIVPFVEAHFAVSHDRLDRIIAGHSSGGFGALRVAIQFPSVFGRCIAMSPDSDFEISHRPLAMKPEVVNTPLAQIRAWQEDATADRPTMVTGETNYIVALSAAYAPLGRSKPGRFEWLFTESGQFREEIWKRWMANDPLEIVRRDPKALKREASVYLDGGHTDSYKANIGASKISAILASRGIRTLFYESPGGHGTNKPYRIAKAILWTLGATK